MSGLGRMHTPRFVIVYHLIACLILSLNHRFLLFLLFGLLFVVMVIVMMVLLLHPVIVMVSATLGVWLKVLLWQAFIVSENLLA